MMVEMIITGAPDGCDSGDWGGATKQQWNDNRSTNVWTQNYAMEVSIQKAYDERLLCIMFFYANS